MHLDLTPRLATTFLVDALKQIKLVLSLSFHFCKAIKDLDFLN